MRWSWIRSRSRNSSARALTCASATVSRSTTRRRASSASATRSRASSGSLTFTRRMSARSNTRRRSASSSHLSSSSRRMACPRQRSCSAFGKSPASARLPTRSSTTGRLTGTSNTPASRFHSARWCCSARSWASRSRGRRSIFSCMKMCGISPRSRRWARATRCSPRWFSCRRSPSARWASASAPG